MQEFKTADGVIISGADVVSVAVTTEKYCPKEGTTFSSTVFRAQLTGVVKDLVSAPCGYCEECTTNGMPHYCQAPQLETAYYYKEVVDNARLYGDEDGFFIYR